MTVERQHIDFFSGTEQQNILTKHQPGDEVMDLKLNDKVAVILASSTGLGFATACELAKEGAKIVICGRDQARLDMAKNQLNEYTEANNSLAFPVDITDPTSIKQMLDKTATIFNHIDILITNAGGPPVGKFETLDQTAWLKAFNLTLMSAVNTINAALPFLKQSQSGSIVTVTSISAKEPIPGLFLSNIFRPAVIGLTKSLSMELGEYNIRVNSILPGWTKTDRSLQLLQKRAEQQDQTLAEVEQVLIKDFPLKRMAEPEEFAKAATFLASPAASYINGMMLHVDGGSYKGLI